ncbi:MAG TPA: DNA glycosylase [Candidatus Acidoferrum sp.]|nr:DNA glycosylase [Candidatus Acidoferrum sp.]
MLDPTCQHVFALRDYDLAATLLSGQAFRWRQNGVWFEGVVGNRWVGLQQTEQGILAETAMPVNDWRWLTNYLQTDIDLAEVVHSFPDDEPMRAAISACRGLRLLRQDPWECLASFILSSTKQIVQIQQIVALLCERFGDSLIVPAGHAPVFSFPNATRLAACAEPELRDCKMGFRAPNLLRAANMVAHNEIDLEGLRSRTVDEARDELLKLPGVGNKIANCVLLFGYGFQQAFPVDVWVLKALQQLYFPKRRASAKRLARFTATHFGPNAGYAQQYLFHYMRVHAPDTHEDRTAKKRS